MPAPDYKLYYMDIHSEFPDTMVRDNSEIDEIHSRFELPNAIPRYPRDVGFRINNLTLNLEVDLEARTIRGKAVYTLSPLEGLALDSISFDARELSVDSVKCDGKPVEFSHIDDTVTFSAGGSRNEIGVEIEYSGRPESGIYFVYPDSETPEKPFQAWSQGEDEYSKYWFPCFDAPNMKFTTDFHITVKSDYFVVSNGMLTGVTENREKGNKTYHWKESVPHSSYLNSIAVGDFAKLEDSFKGIPVEYYVQRGREEEAMRSFGKTPDMMKFFTEIIGVDYPYEKYSQVAVSDFIWGGMENISATTQTDETLHDSRAENDFPSHPLVAHELAHQWWGDLVTTKDWSNIWLNEGFATYFEARYRKHDLGQDEFEYYLDTMAQTYFSEDAKDYRRPVVQRSYLVPTELFDRTTYQKGALVLNMLCRELGDDMFFRSLNRYCRDNRMKNVETSDLLKAIESSTGRNMQSFFDQWVYSAGYPEFKAKYSYNEKEKQVEIKFSQTQKTDAMTPVFNVDLDISMCLPGGKRVNEVARIRAAESRIVFAAGARPRFVSIDPHNDILKKLDYERPLSDSLAQLAEGTPFEKVQAAREIAKKSRADVVKALGKQLAADNFWAVHAECAEALGKINRTDALEALLSAKVSDSRARKVVARAIGYYRDGKTAHRLEEFLEDESYAVQAEAVTSLSRLHDYRPEGVLSRALLMPSHMDVVRRAALVGYGESGSASDIEKLREFLSKRYRPRVRAAAIKSIARLGKEDERTRQFVYGQLRDDNIVYRSGVIEACALTENADAVQVLSSHAERERDGRLKRQALESVAAVRKALSKPEEIRTATREIEEIKGDIREVRHAVEALERRLKAKRK